MEFQNNPYLIWQLIPGVILFGITFYIQTRRVKKRESTAFSLLMISGSLWAFANAIQLITADVGWQKFWNSVVYLGIMIVPTAWFLLSVKLTGFLRYWVEKFETYFWIPPAVLSLFVLTNGFHKLLFKSFNPVTMGGYVTLENNYGPLFYIHTVYSYILIISGVILLTVSLITKFKRYGVQGYGLIIGVLAPLIGNAYFLFGSPSPGFPDPTPIFFTVTGIAFFWAIFGGNILEVVPLAHESIVRKLSTGVVILDAQKNIREINDAAREMLGLLGDTYPGDSLLDLIRRNDTLSATTRKALNEAIKQDQDVQFTFPETRQTYNLHISNITDKSDKTTGWLIQFNDISEKKQAEENLVIAKETLESVLDTLQDGYFEADRKGVITYANRAFVESLGYSRLEEVQGRKFRNFTDRKAVRRVLEKFKALYDKNQPLETFDFAYRTKDGGTRFGEITASPVLNGETIVGSRGLVRDITVWIHAERETLRQKDLLDSLIQQSPIAMVINDMKKKITVVNPAFEKLFGYARQEVVGKKLEDILSAPGVATDEQELSTLVMKEQTSREGKRRRKDNSLVHVEMFFAPFFVGGEQFGYLAFYNDISDRLKAETEREKVQLTYRAVLDSLHDPYFEADRVGILTFVNQAFVNTIGYLRREEIVGKHFRAVASRKNVRPVYENFKKAFETRKALEPFEFIYRNRDGVELTSEMVVSPILDNGEAIGTRGIVRDISVRVKAEGILRQAKDAAELRAGELATINRISGTVGRSLDLENILQSVCVELTNVFPIRNAGIGLLTIDKKSLEIVAFHAIDSEEKSALGLLLPLEGNMSSQEVLEKKRTILIQDAQSDPRTSSIANISRTRGTKSIMIVPLLVRGDAIGTIGMPAKDPDHIFTRNEVEQAETIASQIAAAVDNAQLHAKTESALGVAERDLEIGRQIQSGFFPETLPVVPGWEIATHFHAARQVAGDFYDVFQFKKSKLIAFIIADVCDKGVGAALFMVLFRSLLRAFSETQLNQDNVKEQLLHIILSTNNFIAEYHGKSNMFATLFFGILDPDSGTLYYVNGGHEPPVILNKDGKTIQRLMPTGPAVGMFPEMNFQVAQIHFDENDFLVGFTDGTTDAKNISGTLFSEERLLRTIAAPWASMFSMLFELNTELQRHIGAQAQFDDITLISFRRKSKLNQYPHTISRPARLDALGELRSFVEAAAEYCELHGEDIFSFKLTVDELCTNIIQYGYEDRAPGMISLSFIVEGNRARLAIRDDGKYFSPDQAKSPDIEADWDAREEEGLGLYFVKELMDNVTYNRTEENINQIVIEKELTRSNSQKE